MGRPSERMKKRGFIIPESRFFRGSIDLASGALPRAKIFLREPALGAGLLPPYRLLDRTAYGH